MTRSLYYILDGKRPVVADVIEWALWYGSANRHVAEETVNGAWVSTVFLGMDHSCGVGPPVLFESMVFGGPLNDERQRYRTWEEAERGHAELVQRVRESGPVVVEHKRKARGRKL